MVEVVSKVLRSGYVKDSPALPRDVFLGGLSESLYQGRYSESECHVNPGLLGARVERNKFNDAICFTE